MDGGWGGEGRRVGVGRVGGWGGCVDGEESGEVRRLGGWGGEGRRVGWGG